MPSKTNSQSIADLAVQGFTHDFSGRSASALGIFGGEGSGKTRFGATATEWAIKRGLTSAWLVWDRKTRLTVRRIHEENGWPLPLINAQDFITPKAAIEIARLDRDTDKGAEEIKKVYNAAYTRVLDIVGPLVESPKVNPIIIETGTALYDMISFAHFGKKQGVGRDRVWGPPKQDWTDLMDLLANKHLIISFWEKDEYKADARTGRTKPDGPNHLGYTLTSLVRFNHNRLLRNPDELFTLDVIQSQDNTGLEGQDGLLKNDDITYTNLIDMLRPEEA